MVKVLPLPASRFVYRVANGRKVDCDLLEVFGFDGSERSGDPLNVQLMPYKLHVFELCGLG